MHRHNGFTPIASALPLSSNGRSSFCILKSWFQRLPKWNNNYYSYYSWYFHDSYTDFYLFFSEMGFRNKWTKSQPRQAPLPWRKNAHVSYAWGVAKTCKSQTVHQGAGCLKAIFLTLHLMKGRTHIENTHSTRRLLEIGFGCGHILNVLSLKALKHVKCFSYL